MSRANPTAAPGTNLFVIELIRDELVPFWGPGEEKAYRRAELERLVYARTLAMVRRVWA